MSSPVNFYRDKRHTRTIFREGRYLLASEGMEIQLESITALREQIKRVLGEYAALGDALKIEIDPSNSERLLIRPGEFFMDGYPLRIQSGTDHLTSLGVAPVEIDGSDFIQIDSDGSDVGGIAINFGGLTAVPSGTYSIVVTAQEQLITAANDPYLRSANLDEDTAEKHRVVLNFNVIETSKLNSAPVPYVGTSGENLVNEVQITPTATNYVITDIEDLTGTEVIDGRNIQVKFNNGNGSTTAAFPTSNTDLEEYIHGKLIDSNGLEYHISSIFVTPGDASSITMQLDLEKTRPVALATNQPNPVVTESVPYRLVKRDLYVTNAANLPQGQRFWEVLQVDWDGASFSNLTDKRQKVLAVDGVLGLIRNQGLNLFSEGLQTWNKDENSGTLTWDQPWVINSVFETLEWTIAAGDTFSLFGSALADGEVLYVDLLDAPSGGSLTLKKGVRGTGDLVPERLQSWEIFWVAKRCSDDRVYFSNGQIYNHEQTKPFYDELPDRRLREDILTLGYKSMFEDRLEVSQNLNPASSTGTFFADAYQLQYVNKTITVIGNTVTFTGSISFPQVGDIVVQGPASTLVTGINSPTSLEVADGSALTTTQNAVISQVAETFNVRDLGDTAKERISSYFTDNVDNILVFYDDSVIPNVTNPVKIGFSATSDGSTYSDAFERPQGLDDLYQKSILSTSGTDVRVRFFAVDTTSDGTATLESYRVYLHDRTFVGTLLAAVAQTAGGGGGPATEAVVKPPATDNNSGQTLLSGRAVRITSSGLDYAQASSVAGADPTIGILTNNVLDGASTDEIVGSGLAAGVITGLGFSPGDTIFLGIDGQLVNAATVLGFPPGYVQKELGFAYNATDMWVQIGSLEIP